MSKEIKLRIRLIIGLGNPNKKYSNTYHNVGILAVNYLSKILDSRFQILASDSYMNESGKFIAKELRRNGLKPSELLIVHDDSDLELGTYKLQFGRGAAGHHGAESVIAVLGTKDFWRLRIGVRKEERGKGKEIRVKAGTFVLKLIKPVDREALESVFKKSLDALVPLLRN